MTPKQKQDFEKWFEDAKKIANELMEMKYTDKPDFIDEEKYAIQDIIYAINYLLKKDK